jgi:uncharacterized Zn-binding protein involved in type VI secretion
MIGGKPAARAGDTCLCGVTAPEVIIGGSGTVVIGGKPAARMGDKTSQGSVIRAGLNTVIIGG